MQPCIFCGNADVELKQYADKGYYVFCRRCGTQAPRSMQKDIAIILWNKPPRAAPCLNCKKDMPLNEEGKCGWCESI